MDCATERIDKCQQLEGFCNEAITSFLVTVLSPHEFLWGGFSKDKMCFCIPLLCSGKQMSCELHKFENARICTQCIFYLLAVGGMEQKRCCKPKACVRLTIHNCPRPFSKNTKSNFMPGQTKLCNHLQLYAVLKWNGRKIECIKG